MAILGRGSMRDKHKVVVAPIRTHTANKFRSLAPSACNPDDYNVILLSLLLYAFLSISCCNFHHVRDVWAPVFSLRSLLPKPRAGLLLGILPNSIINESVKEELYSPHNNRQVVTIGNRTNEATTLPPPLILANIDACQFHVSRVCVPGNSEINLYIYICFVS